MNNIEDRLNAVEQYLNRLIQLGYFPVSGNGLFGKKEFNYGTRKESD